MTMMTTTAPGYGPITTVDQLVARFENSAFDCKTEYDLTSTATRAEIAKDSASPRGYRPSPQSNRLRFDAASCSSRAAFFSSAIRAGSVSRRWFQSSLPYFHTLPKVRSAL